MTYREAAQRLYPLLERDDLTEEEKEAIRWAIGVAEELAEQQ